MAAGARARERAEFLLVGKESQEGSLSVGADMLLPSPHSCLALLSESPTPGLTICQPSRPQRACDDYHAAAGEHCGTLEEGVQGNSREQIWFGILGTTPFLS